MTAKTDDIDATLASPAAKGDAPKCPQDNEPCNTSDCCYSAQPDAERPGDAESIEAELESWLHATGPTSKHYERVFAAVRQLRERAEADGREIARLSEEIDRLTDTTPSHWYQQWADQCRLTEAATARMLEVSHIHNELMRQRNDRIAQLEAQLGESQNEAARAANRAIDSFNAVVAERDQLRAQLAKQDEGERTVVWRCVNQVTGDWSEFNFEEDAREQVSGQRGYDIVEVTQFHRVLSGAGSEGSNG